MKSSGMKKNDERVKPFVKDNTYWFLCFHKCDYLGSCNQS